MGFLKKIKPKNVKFNQKMCGACAQVCLEFGDNWLVYSVKPNREYEVHTIREMLPLAFHPGDLEKFNAQTKK